MKHVRLPIYDENGMQQPGYLAVDLNYFVPPYGTAMRSSMARVVLPEEHVTDLLSEDLQENPGPRADWEKQLLWDIETNAIDKAVADAKAYNESKPKPVEETEWRDLEGIPTKYFEINRDGDIRHKHNGKIMDLRMDEDRLKPCVKLIINREEYWIDGPGLAKKMWGE